MHDTATEGQTEADEPIWFLPAGAAEGERNEHRFRGWKVVVLASAAFWIVVAGAVWAVVSLF